MGNQTRILDSAWLRGVILKHEGEALEFKEKFPKQGHDLVKIMVASADTRGGEFLMGVSNDGRVVGVWLF